MKLISRISKRAWMVIGVIVVLLIAVRIALPHYALYRANKAMATMGQSTGSIEDVDLALFKGQYTVKGVVIEKKNSDANMPYLIMPEVVMHFKWKKGFVSEADVYNQEVNIVSGNTQKQKQDGDYSTWKKVLNTLSPFNIDDIRVHNGSVNFYDRTHEPEVHLWVNEVSLNLSNILNNDVEEDSLPATLDLSFMVMGEALCELKGKANPQDSSGTFLATLTMEELEISSLNPMLEAYANLDVEAGTYSMYGEVEAREGDLDGYLEAVVKHLSISTKGQEKEDKFFERIWEGLVEVVVSPFKQKEQDQIVTRLDLTGSLDSLNMDKTTVISTLFRSALFQAVQPGLDGDVELNTSPSPLESE